MALWGNNDNLYSVGTITVNYSTLAVTGSGTSFTALSEGDVIRVGLRTTGTYFGDAVIAAITNNTNLSIASTAGLSGAAISGADFLASQLPSYSVLDVKYSESPSGTEDSHVYGITTSIAGDYGTSGLSTNYHVAHHGWVGVTTYVDMHGNLRVKSEVLVAQSGIQTGDGGVPYPTSVV